MKGGNVDKIWIENKQKQKSDVVMAHFERLREKKMAGGGCGGC